MKNNLTLHPQNRFRKRSPFPFGFERESLCGKKVFILRRNKMNHYQKSMVFFLVAILVFFFSAPARAADGFTQKDRELLITLKVKVEEIDKRFE